MLLPSIRGVTNARMIIKEDSNRFVRKLETKPVFVGIIYPFSDEEWTLLAAAQQRILLGRHGVESGEDSIVQS